MLYRKRPIGIILAAICVVAPFVVVVGAKSSSGAFGQVELVWGQHGGQDGFFKKPRAIAISDQDQLYIVDKSARIQVFDRQGDYLRGWEDACMEIRQANGVEF